jgi:hypothetical protein
MKVLHQDCNPEVANDRSLPYNTYLVSYIDDEVEKYDLVLANKKIEIFDYYWDKYREGLLSFKQSEGRMNPKLWNIEPKVSTKKKK